MPSFYPGQKANELAKVAQERFERAQTHIVGGHGELAHEDLREQARGAAGLEMQQGAQFE